MKSREKRDERALGYVAAGCYAFSLALCGLVAYAFVMLTMAVGVGVGETPYFTVMGF